MSFLGRLFGQFMNTVMADKVAQNRVVRKAAKMTVNQFKNMSETVKDKDKVLS